MLEAARKARRPGDKHCWESAAQRACGQRRSNLRSQDPALRATDLLKRTGVAADLKELDFYHQSPLPILGQMRCRIDQNDVIVLPSDYMTALIRNKSSGEFALFADHGPSISCIEIGSNAMQFYIAGRMARSMRHSPSLEHLNAFSFSALRRLENSNQLRIPAEMVKYAELENEVVLSAIGYGFEIWSLAGFCNANRGQAIQEM
jgi:DNA-binding transcriptional regulator/RsmH inhibitor MraZ